MNLLTKKMKSIFEKETREELLKRIELVDEKRVALWGKMTVSQMIKHCNQWDEMALGKVKYKQSLLGKLFGKMALKGMLKDAEIKKNLPTVPSFAIKDQPDFATEKRKWLNLVAEYENLKSDGIMHPFFGALNKERTGIFAYKHANHHLLQFGC